MSISPRRLALIVKKAQELHDVAMHSDKPKLWEPCIKEAMDYFPMVDKIWAMPIEILAQSEFAEVAEWLNLVTTNDDIIKLAREGKMITAIKLYRERMDCDLSLATQWVKRQLND